uniref:Uncharacterized protein n=1 Tax=Bionectria ochroleuca TaxID=29856 RepID=A0A8H7NLT4_BIOOC
MVEVVEDAISPWPKLPQSAAATPKKHGQETDAHRRHADIVTSIPHLTAITIALAKHPPHGQQSQLVDFIASLWQSDVPNPTDGGGVLQLGLEKNSFGRKCLDRR